MSGAPALKKRALLTSAVLMKQNKDSIATIPNYWKMKWEHEILKLNIKTRFKSDAFLETSFSEYFLNIFITCCNIFITYESFNIHEFSMFCAPIVNQEIYQYILLLAL